MNLAIQTDLLAGFKLHARKVFQGIPVSIENRAGSTRSGVDPGGKPWHTKMLYDYGRIPRTRGMDGEPIDAFLGPHQDAKNAYIITIKKAPDFTADDEEKVMLGFDSPATAKKAFHANYNNEKFFGRMEAMPMAEFKEKALGNGLHPQKVAASFDSLAAPMGMAHIEPIPTFHPPSIKNPRRVPTDDPGETDDSDLNVTKRHEKGNEDLRRRIASRKGSDFKNLAMGIRTTALPWGPATGEGGIAASGGTMHNALPNSRLWRRKLRERAAAERKDRNIRAYGTTEGVLKEWDERGRGRTASGPSGGPAKAAIEAPTRPLGEGETTEEAWRDPQTGLWNMQREAFHEAVVDKMVEGKTPPVGRKPIAWILGGGTASGKTTASRAILGDDPNVLRVDPDEIKLAIPEYDGLKKTDEDHAAARVHEESSYLTKMAMAEAAARGLDLTYDSTTSGNGGAAMAKMMAANGYDVRVMFVDVPISVARERSALRAKSSKDPVNFGRKVPDDVIVAAHRGAAKKFFELKEMPGLTSIQMYDNTGKEPRLVYQKKGGEEHVFDQARLDQYRKKGLGQSD